jgi:GAF domain-containing protein
MQTPLSSAVTKPSAAERERERARSQALLDGQNRILQLINDDRPLDEILTAICLTIEAQVEGLHCSVLLLDGEGQHLLHGAAPSLPPDYCAAIHGLSVGPNVGSCGTAAYTGKPCVVEDIATHPNWAAFRDLATTKFGLRACWSTPIRSYEGEVVATFAMYYRTPKLPSLYERKLIDFSSHLVAIAVNRDMARSELAADVL